MLHINLRLTGEPWVGDHRFVLEGQLLHEQVDPRVHFKAVKIVGISL